MQQNRDEGVEQAPQPTLCSNNCGFYASGSGLCSKCNRERTPQAVMPSPALTAAAVANATAASVAASSKPSAAEAAATADNLAAAAVVSPSGLTPRPEAAEASTSALAAAIDEPVVKSAPTRCAHPDCRKKVGLTSFKCKCDKVYCGGHRLAEDHSCPHDYKTQQRQKLAAQNPLVAAAKVQRI